MAQNEQTTEYARAAVNGKARSPSVVRRVVGMTSVDLEALRRRRRESTSAVKWRQQSVDFSAAKIFMDTNNEHQ